LGAIAQAPGVYARRAHAHTFAAVDTAITAWPQSDVQAQAVDAFLATTVQSAVCVTTTSATTSVRVILDNVAAGHSFPSGAAQDRRLRVERSEEHTSELQSPDHLVCRLLLEKKEIARSG